MRGFSLKNGVYATGQAGAATIINYHHEHEPQQYAIDILELNKAGVRATGLTPSDLEAYEIYNASFYSPYTGEVIQAVDQYEDIPPLESPKEVKEAKGNHVILTCENTEVILAHMKPGTVQAFSENWDSFMRNVYVYIAQKDCLNMEYL